MNIALIFESFEGQTKRIAAFVTERLKESGHSVKLFNTADRSASLHLDGIDKVVLAAPVHERRHPKDFEVIVATQADKLKTLPTMMLSVSLKASFEEGRAEAQEYLNEMKMRIGISFDCELLVAGAVRAESYGYFESQIVHHVVLEGRPVDLIDGVREYTDWDALNERLGAFMSGA